MRPSRRSGHFVPANATIFQVDVMVVAEPGSDTIERSWTGYVEDEEDVGNPDVGPALFVAAEHVDLQTRLPMPLWEEVVPL